MGRLVGAFFVFLLALGLSAGAFFTTRSTLAFRASALRVDGTVVDFSVETKTDNGKRTTMYRPVVEFTAASGKTIRFNSSVSSSSPGYGRGDKVPVLYYENTPEKARIDSFMSNWMGPLVLGILGFVTLLASAGLVFTGLRS
jgi:ABC-type Na+ efflux pump permease subunit